MTLVKTVVNGKTVYSLPHRAKVVEDSTGNALFMEYKGRKVADA
jgi:large subunit ribosomal protein L32